MAKYLDEAGLKTLWAKIKTEDGKRLSTALKGAANGVAELDANGNVPLSQLGNLDTTFMEVVTTLPTEGIKRHLYLKAENSTGNNIYTEYLYTGNLPIQTDTSASDYSTNKYDASNWEKMGKYQADIDLSPYAKKSEALKSVTPSVGTSTIILTQTKVDGGTSTVSIGSATQSVAGAMSAADKKKLDGIATGANAYSLPTASSTTLGGVKVGNNLSISNGVLSGAYGTATSSTNGLMSSTDKSNLDRSIYDADLNTSGDTCELSFSTNAGNTATTLDFPVATTTTAGLLSKADKSKLDGIASGANKYTHPTYTSHASGLYKVTVDGTGHVSAATAVAKSDITALGIPAQDTNTHYASYTLFVSSADTNAEDANAIANGKVYLNHVENGVVKSSHLIKGTGATTVTKDSSGNIVINSTDNNTTYSAGSGLSLSGTTFGHASSITAGTVGTSSATSGITLAVPYVTYNSTGHITAVGTHTHTIPVASGATADSAIDTATINALS